MSLFTALSWVSIAIAFASAMIIAVDELRHPQKMWIMNVVWPTTALYGSVFALWGYFKLGRRSAKDHADAHAMEHGEEPKWPTAAQTAIAVSHCGAGCALGDIAAEFAVFGLGLTLFGSELWASYAVDFAAAWSLGIVFQYFSIKPMSEMSAGQAICAAIKADTFSITAFQVGMYAWMAVVFFVLFPAPHHLRADQPQYWLMMQIAMVFGFATAYPMNAVLVRLGWKEAMG
jgi:hypothetical protein